jgi:hypothetical protein
VLALDSIPDTTKKKIIIIIQVNPLMTELLLLLTKMKLSIPFIPGWEDSILCGCQFSSN